MKNWKRRYFQLDENTIGYFKSELVITFSILCYFPVTVAGSMLVFENCAQLLLQLLSLYCNNFS